MPTLTVEPLSTVSTLASGIREEISGESYALSSVSAFGAATLTVGGADVYTIAADALSFVSSLVAATLIVNQSGIKRVEQPGDRDAGTVLNADRSIGTVDLNRPIGSIIYQT